MGSERDFDVIVVGSGAAGLSAALSATEAGASVLVVESEGVVGGSSRLAGGVVMASRSKLQKAAGIEDEEGALYREYMSINGWDLSAGPVRAWASSLGETVDWLSANGVPFYEQMIFGGDESRARGHCVEGGGQALVSALAAACKKAGVDIALGRRVERLVVEDGTVVGIESGGETLTAGSVVLATGGFGANPALLEQFYPSSYVEDETFYIGADGARGDHVEFAEQLGAQLTGVDRGLRMLNPGVDKVHEAFLPGWTILVDRNGHRFTDETAPYGILDALMRNRGNVGFVIFDDACVRPPADKADRYRDAYKQVWPNHAPFRPKHYTAEVMELFADHERVHIANTVEELADAIGLPRAELAGEIDRYNGLVAAGADTDYNKPAKFLNPLSTGPFYAVEVRPTAVAHTGYGLKIDESGAVVSRNGHAIDGLFAAGECTGGISGRVYMGSGSSLSSAAGFGRISGAAAAKRAARTAVTV
ncbi:FAD-dependent oxidoreductase [Gordonia sp. GONU]|uniref:FAD-dependent oxidoreductase n=1 Tax=Gordonia sp. GONU TaxID=2972949 RepID=UPI0021AC5937|nr:FAD-dependent oxidoreductase [Gordonia sp. GONU]MCR8899748.1 FAD-dependent oxidoreductase [Gordonia sp. GONU]